VLIRRRASTFEVFVYTAFRLNAKTPGSSMIMIRALEEHAVLQLIHVLHEAHAQDSCMPAGIEEKIKYNMHGELGWASY
jgi:hypothetical protein